MGFLNNVAVQWLIRRVPDIGGWVTFVVSIYLALPQEHKETVMAVLSGQGGGLTVSAVLGLAAFLYAQLISFRSTVKPKEVEKVGGASVEVSAPRKSLWDILQGK